MKKIIFFLFLCLFLSKTSLIFAQNGISDVVNTSKIIVEGKVIAQKVVRNEDFVFTYNTLLISKVFKGELRQDSVIIPLYGGVLEGIEHSYTHSDKLNLADEGVFCLIPFHLDVKNAFSLNKIQGFFRYTKQEKAQMVDVDSKLMPLNLFFEEIKRTTNKKYSRIRYTDLEKELIEWHNASSFSKSHTCVEYSIQNSKIGIDEGLKLEFDLYLRAFPYEIPFVKSTLHFSYDKSLFGENLVKNGNIKVEKGEFLKSPNYNIELLDENEEKLKIEVNSKDLSDLSKLGFDGSQLCHISIAIDATDLKSMLNLNLQEQLSTECYMLNFADKVVPIDCIKFQGNLSASIQQLMPPVIFDFSPKIVAAGIRDIVTITGSNFGTVKGNIEFANAYGPKGFFEVMPNDILTWTNNKITVNVSSCGRPLNTIDKNCDGELNYAGTGLIGVRKPSLITEYSDSDLTVIYAVRNSDDGDGNSIPVVLNGEDSDNGVPNSGIWVLYEDKVKMLTGAVKTVERALSTWRCNTRVNFISQPGFSGGSPSILFSPTLGKDGTLAKTSCFIDPTICSSTLNGVSTKYKYMKGFKISIAETDAFGFKIKWNMGIPQTNNLYNFEPIILHELGHAHLVQHTILNTDLMYWKYSTNILLGTNNISAGNKICSISSTDRPNTTGDCSKKMTLIKLSNCKVNNTSNVEDFPQNDMLLIYPNPFQGSFSIQFKSDFYQEVQKISIYNSIGNEVYNLERPIETEKIAIDMAALSSGIYHITLYSQDKTITFKCIKQ